MYHILGGVLIYYCYSLDIPPVFNSTYIECSLQEIAGISKLRYVRRIAKLLCHTNRETCPLVLPVLGLLAASICTRPTCLEWLARPYARGCSACNLPRQGTCSPDCTRRICRLVGSGKAWPACKDIPHCPHLLSFASCWNSVYRFDGRKLKHYRMLDHVSLYYEKIIKVW